MSENNIVTTMEIPRYEYAQLVRKAERLSVIEKLMTSIDAYDLKKVIPVLVEGGEDE